MGVHWHLFGTCGQKCYEAKPVRDRFKEGTINEHIKSIVRCPAKLGDVVRNPHAFYLMGQMVDENRRPFAPHEAKPADPTTNILRLDHFFTKSEEEFRAKCERGCADSPNLRDYAKELI